MGFRVGCRCTVERCFNKLKNARRLATRYDKTADSYLGFIHIVSIRLWMNQFVNASYVWSFDQTRLYHSSNGVCGCKRCHVCLL